MMEFLIEQRKKYILESQNFSNDIDEQLKNYLKSVGCDVFEKLGKNPHNYFTCPFNSQHRVPEKSLEKHLEECEWKCLGYAPKDLPLPISSLPENSTSSIKLDSKLQQKLLHVAKLQDASLQIDLQERLPPKTSDRIFSDYTADERRIFYNHVIENTTKPEIGEYDITEFGKNERNDGKKGLGEMCCKELMAQERDLKRRRAKHRGVHTNKKSQTEILREMIEHQMEELVEFMTKKSEVSKPNLPSKDKELNRNNDKNSNCNEGYNDSFHNKSRTKNNDSQIERYKHRKRSRSKEKYTKSEKIRYSHDHRDKRHKDKKHCGLSEEDDSLGRYFRKNREDEKLGISYQNDSPSKKHSLYNDDKSLKTKDFRKESSTESTECKKRKKHKKHKSHKTSRRKHRDRSIS